MKRKTAIIGGGLAGLCAAIRLAELDNEPIVLEGGTYPCHKVCGEFLSPECLDFLHRWNIYPQEILDVELNTLSSKLVFSFPSPAGGISHFQLDSALAAKASTLGIKISTETKVKTILSKKTPQDLHCIILETGERMLVDRLIIATGRIPSYSSPPQTHYLGFKAHFKGISLTNRLLLFSLPEAYIGLSPVENETVNVAGLIKFSNHASIDQATTINTLISQHPDLSNKLSQGSNLFPEWMITRLPSFGIKSTPKWLDAYFIGDASITVPPACGDGLAMAIIGGRLAAEYAVKNEFQAFKKQWDNQCRTHLYFAKLLHFCMLNPHLGATIMQLTSIFPSIAIQFFKLTRLTPV